MYYYTRQFFNNCKYYMFLIPELYTAANNIIPRE